jgi:hypothetical protein
MRDLGEHSDSSAAVQDELAAASGDKGPGLSRREIIGRLTFFGTAMALLQARAGAQSGSSGSYSAAAMALPEQQPTGSDADELERAVKIARAMRSGPPEVTREATVVEMDHHGNIATVLRKGSNGWLCMPGNENRVGDPPMCVDELGMQWFKDIFAGKPAPTNRAPGLCYMLCGATQHSNDTPSDRTSPAIPIGPHWMILWPFDAKHCGLPTTVRDAGAWVMFARTPYAYLHICGTPWDGNEYAPGDEARWTMQYSKPRTTQS